MLAAIKAASRCARRTRERGVSLVEVLVTLLIVAFGLLGLAGLQSKISVAESESFQRSQAIMALQEIMERMDSNRANAAAYVVAGTVGTGDTQPASCTGIAQGPARDLCEWSNNLKGAGEVVGGNRVGGMLNAVGCIVQVQALNAAPGVCQAGIYQVSVAWQGMSPTATPTLACGAGAFGANDAYRRVISSNVSVGTTTCF
jgi:type IV pilus assembly protein PilV